MGQHEKTQHSDNGPMIATAVDDISGLIHVHMIQDGVETCVKQRGPHRCTDMVIQMYRELDRVLVLADDTDKATTAMEAEARRRREQANAERDHATALRKALMVLAGSPEADYQDIPIMNRRRVAELKEGVGRS